MIPSPQLHHSTFENAMPRLAAGSIDAIISDPPYASTNLPWDNTINWTLWWSDAQRVLKPAGIVVLFSAQKFTTDLINSNRKWFRYELIWEKSNATGFLNANRRPLTAHENILIFAPRLHSTVYNPQKTAGLPYKAGKPRPPAGHYSAKTPKLSKGNPTGARHPRSVLYFPGERRRGNHPTQKPLALMEWLVLTYTNRAQVVLDPFMGSGTTGDACNIHHRQFIDIEQEREYFEDASRRLKKGAHT